VAANEDFRLDGIPVFVHPQGRGDSPLARVSISFRVGTHDEVLAYAGITRLAHQIICTTLPFELREFVHARNGGVFTLFTVSAPVEQFTECLRALAAAIREPDWDATERVQRLLSADPNPDASYPADVMLRDRYGGVGPGTVVLQPMALTAVNQSAMQTWIREHFCMQNAAIVSTESAIEAGSFQLEPGQSHGVLLTAPQALPLPGYSNSGEDGLGFQLLMSASAATDLSIAIIAELVHKRITQLEQLSPRVGFSSTLLDSSLRSFTGSMPISTDNALAGVKAVRQTLNDVADGFLTEDMFERTRSNMQEALRELIRNGEDAMSRSHAAIFSPVQPADATIAALDRLTTQDICRTVRTSLSSLLIYVPDGVHVEDLAKSEIPEPAPVTGKKFRKIGLPLYRANRTTVTVNDEGITCSASGEITTVRYADCTALLDNGVSLQLIDRNGSFVKIYPAMYRKGQDLTKTIRSNIDTTLVVPAAPTDEDLDAQRQAVQHAHDFSGWRAVIGVVALVYLAALSFWLTFQVTRFAGENMYQFAAVLAAIAGLVWVFRPQHRRQRFGVALRATAEMFRHLSPGLVLTYLIDTLLVIRAWDFLVRQDPPNYWGSLLLVLALVPFAFALFTYKRSASTGKQRYLQTFRSIWIGNIAQMAVVFVTVLVATSTAV
jgi:hypothetical protein